MLNNKKKAACAAMLCMAMTMPFASLAENETRVITCGTLNLREQPEWGAAIVASMPNGAAVRIYGAWQGWYVVHYGEYVGYAAAEFIRT